MIDKYYHDVAYHLRFRGYTEDEIAAILAELARKRPKDTESLAARFGTAEQYAATFPRQNDGPKPPGIRAVHATYVVAGAWLVLSALTGLLFAVPWRIGGPWRFNIVTLWPALGILVVGSLLGWWIDARRPAPSFQAS